jgi:cell wall/surface protein
MRGKVNVLSLGNEQDNNISAKKTKDEVAKELGANLAAQPREVAATTQQNLRGTQSQEVADWQGLVNALNDYNIGTIKLTSDITVANKGTNVNGINRPQPLVNSGKMNLTGSNISGGLDIDGQGHAINFGANYLSFTTNNQKDSNPWDIAFKNLTINADGYDNSWSSYGGAFSPIYMGGNDIRTDLLANNKVTFENVTADVKNGAFYNTTMAQQIGDNPYTTVTFKGNNNITCEAVNVAGNQVSNYSSAVSAAHIIFADGSNTIFNVSSAKTNNDQNAGGNILRAKVEDETNDTAPAIDVQQGATVTLNGQSKDVKGMLVNSAITGTVQVDGNLNANMADGHSMAIWAGNLNIGKTGVVNINTKQSNDGSGANGGTNYDGYHFAPISLGVGFAANITNADSNVLDNQGKLIIVRTGDNNQSTTPLISFGSGSGSSSKWDLNVHEGATLDLQDNAQPVLNSVTKGFFTNTPKYGLVTMWGGGTGDSYNHVTITNPKYVNFQRTGNQTGTLLRLENKNNNVTITSAGGKLPFAQWDEGNKGTGASDYWYLNNIETQNNWGDNAISGFTQAGNTLGQNKNGEIKFLHSNGQVNLAQNQAGFNSFQFIDGTVTQGQPADGVKYETPYLNRLLNNFNWWTPQRVAMGSSLEEVAKPTDSGQYQPVVKTIDGNTKQTLNDLTAKDGISGLRTSDGTITPDLSAIKNVDWYNAATDATEWQDLMSGQDAPTNPTGNLKTSDKSAWAKVTYQDGTVDFANIPLNITNPDADVYQPSYDPMNVKQGESKSEDPSYPESTPQGSAVTINPGSKAPEGTKYKIVGDNTPFATVDPNTGWLTIAPTTETPTGLTTIPVVVTYPDTTKDTVHVPVYVGNATHTGKIIPDPTDPTKTGALEVVTAPSAFDKAHETTDNSMNLTAGQAVSAINQYTVGEDGKVTSTPVDKTSAIITWKGDAPTTVVTTPSASEDLTGTVSVKVGDTTVDSNPMTIKAAGATAKDVTNPVKVTVGQDLTDAQKNDLVDTFNLDNAGIQYTASWASAPKAGDTQATIRLTFTDKDAQGNPTYLDVQTKDGAINAVPAGEYSPSYKTVTVEKGSTASDPVVTTNGVPKPDGTKFVAGDNVPTWATVDSTTGTITLKPGQDATPGFYKIPVTVSVPGKDTQTVTAPVMITGNDPEHHTYYGNQSMTSFITPTISVHRTTDSHELDPNIAKIQQIVYRTDWDGKGSAASDYKTVTTYNLQGDKYVNAQDPSDSFDANVIKYSWVKAGNGILTPNSNWDITNGTGDILYDPANPNSKEQTSSGESLPGNSKWRVNYSFDDSDLFGYIGLSTQDSWMNTYFNFYGSTTNQSLTFKQNQNISNLSQDQFKTLINVNSLENGWGGTNSSDSAQANDSAKTFTMNWAENGQPSTKNIANGVKGTVRINFSDGTYLDVPATINVEAATPTPENFTQSIVYKDAKGNVIFTAKDAIKGQFTSTTPAIVSAEAQKNTIDSNVPEKWVISKSYTYPSAETVNTTAPSAIEVLVEHGTKDITPTTPGVNPTDPKYKDMFKTVTRDIYQTKPGEAEKKIDTQSVEFGRNGIEDLVTGEVTGTGNWQAGTIQNHKFVLGGQPEFVSMNAPQISDYDSYVNGTKTTTVSSASALNNGQPVNGAAVHITYLKSDNITPVPYNPSDKDMNKDVTRTITIYKTDGTTDIITQNVHFVRGGEGQNAGTKDQDGNITWTEWTVATKDNNSWKSTGASEGSWQEYDVTPVDGYKSTVNGHEATKVDAKTVNADTPNANVTVAYTKTTEPTDPTINPNKPGENSDMYAHPTRTINVKNPVTGKTDTSTQVVWFGRTKTVSTDPNVKTVYGDWQLGKVENDKFIIDKDATSTWPAFTAPAFTGFTPSQDSVAEVTPTADTKDAVVTITYTKNGGGEITPPTPQQGQVTIIYRDENGNEVGRTTIPGTEGTTIDPSSAIKNGVPAGYKIKDGYNAPTSASVSSSITVPVVKTDNGGNTTPSDNKPTDKTPGKDDNSGKKADHHKAKNNGQNIRTETKHNSGNNQAAGLNSENHSYNSNVHGKRANSNNTAVQAEKNAKTLPQTGEKQNRASIIGLALASIAGLLGFGVDRKRKHN